MTDGLDKFLAGTTEAFGGPAANNNAARRCRPDIILLALSVGVVLGFGVLAFVIVDIAVSKRPVTAMPVIAAEAPGRTEGSFPSASIGPAPSTPAPSTMLGTMASPSFNAAAARAQLTAWWCVQETQRAVGPAVAAGCVKAASHANKVRAVNVRSSDPPHSDHASDRKRWRVRPVVPRDEPERDPISQLSRIAAPTPMPTPQDFGCPASLGAACAAQR
jgi:hypothetical protein